MGILFYGHDAIAEDGGDNYYTSGLTLGATVQENKAHDWRHSSNRAVIFLGPSLSVNEAKKIFPEAEYLPPVAMGDLISLVDDTAVGRPWGIGIIDGMFYQSLPVWHKEILYALEKGVAVFGASSMGALRAAECDSFGMVGIGEVYRMYASGELVDDDEVALAHEGRDGGWKKRSEPMVNLRATIQAACDDGLLSPRSADTLINIAKSLWFPERTIYNILQLAEQQGLDNDVLASANEVLTNRYVDLKRSDAIQLLATMRSLYERVTERDSLPESRDEYPIPPDDQHEPLRLACTLMFEAMSERERKVVRNGVSISQEEIARYVAVSYDKYAYLRSRVLDRFLAGSLANIYEVSASEDDIAVERNRLCTMLLITNDDDLRKWLRENDLTEDAFHELVVEEARLRKVRDWAHMFLSKRQVTGLLLNELKLTGEYVKLADDAAMLSGHYPIPTQREPGTMNESYRREVLADRLRSGRWRPDTNLEKYANEAGFQDVWDLFDELDRHYRWNRLGRSFIDAMEGMPTSTTGREQD